MTRPRHKPFVSIIDGKLKDRRNIPVNYEPERTRAGISPETLVPVKVGNKKMKKSFSKINLEYEL